MKKIKNEAVKQNDTIEMMRKNFEHRATWMGLIYDEGKKRGVDLEEIIRAAIKRTGHIHGENIKAANKNPDSVGSFGLTFLDDNGVKCFQMDIQDPTADKMDVEFHYCPLVSAWEKLGFDQETMAKLCDMAMDGDRGIAQANGFKFELGDTIAKGNSCCELHFKK